MKEKGIAHIGIGYAKGDDKASEAVKMAVESPLLETTISGATHVIINVSGDITLADASDAASYVQDLAGDDVNIIFGAMYDANKADTCTITVIATGLEDANAKPASFGTYKPGYITPTSLQGKNAIGAGVMNPGVAGPAVNILPNSTHAATLKTISGINKPGDIRSSVEEKTLKIPDFLQRK